MLLEGGQDGDKDSAYLEAADESVRHIVLEQVSSSVVYAGPAPHVFAGSLGFTLVQDSSADSPHDDAEDEESHGEDGVVGGYLLCSAMTSS